MKQPKSFEEGMDRLKGQQGQLQDESTQQVEEIDASLAPGGEVSHEA